MSPGVSGGRVSMHYYLPKRLEKHNRFICLDTFRVVVFPCTFISRNVWRHITALCFSRRFVYSYFHALLSPETSGDITAEHHTPQAYTFINIAVRATHISFVSASCYSCCAFRIYIAMRNLIRRSVRENEVKWVRG